MKNKVIISSFIAWFVCAALCAQPNDVAAIKEVIAKETESFFAVNRPGWADCWLKVPYAYWSYSDSTGTSFVQGWEGDKGLEKNFENYFKTSKPSKASITNDWLDVKVYGNGPYARFFQIVKAQIYHYFTSHLSLLTTND